MLLLASYLNQNRYQNLWLLRYLFSGLFRPSCGYLEEPRRLGEAIGNKLLDDIYAAADGQLEMSPKSLFAALG